MSVIFNPSAGGAGSGTVTSVGGGVGWTPTPDPLTGAGVGDLDIFKLTAEAALAVGDWFPFVDVSVGTTPAAQRKVTLANLAVGLNPSLDHGALLGLADDDHPHYLYQLGRPGGQTVEFADFMGGNGILRANDTDSGLLVLAVTPQIATNSGAIVIGGMTNVLSAVGGSFPAKFYINHEGGSSAPIVYEDRNSSGGGANLFLACSRMAVGGGPAASAMNDLAGEIAFLGRGNTTYEFGASILAQITEPVPADGMMGAQLLLRTTPNGANVSLLRVLIGQDGETTISAGPTRQLSLNSAGGGRSSFVDSSHAADLDYTLPSSAPTGFLRNVAGALSWAASAPPTYETFAGPSTSVTLAIAPTFVMVFKNGVQQHSVGGAPAEGEYNLSGTTLTVTVPSGSVLDVFEWT